jgi:hypothetical protein
LLLKKLEAAAKLEVDDASLDDDIDSRNFLPKLPSGDDLLRASEVYKSPSFCWTQLSSKTHNIDNFTPQHTFQ